jgi:hypothetical protein
VTLHLPPAEPPADVVAELLDKREHLAVELREAEALYLRLAAVLEDDTLPGWQRCRLEVELSLAGRRLELYRDCLAELRRQLGAHGVAA